MKRSVIAQYGFFIVITAALFCMFFTSCESLIYNPPQRVVLTEDMVIKYKIKAADFAALQFYLSNPLDLENVSTSRTKEVHSRHWLDMHEKKQKEILHLKKNLRGVFIDYVPEKTYFFLYRKKMQLIINFDEKPNQYLIFSPDSKGDFVLQYDRKNNSIKYGTAVYNCVGGCADRFLQIDIRQAKEYFESERYLRGNSLGRD